MKLSENFSLDEFVRSDTAKKLNIDNTPNEKTIENLKALCSNILEPLRKKLQKPIKILSGYRCYELNKTIGGVCNSQHQFGQAADIRVEGMSNIELVIFIHKNFKYDQLILEHNKENDPQSGWIHISWLGAMNRNKYLKID